MPTYIQQIKKSIHTPRAALAANTKHGFWTMLAMLF